MSVSNQLEDIKLSRLAALYQGAAGLLLTGTARLVHGVTGRIIIVYQVRWSIWRGTSVIFVLDKLHQFLF